MTSERERGRISNGAALKNGHHRTARIGQAECRAQQSTPTRVRGATKVCRLARRHLAQLEEAQRVAARRGTHALEVHVIECALKLK